MEMFIEIPFEKRKQSGYIALMITRDLKDGFTYVVKQPFIMKSMVLAALLNLFLTPYFIEGGPIVLRLTMGSGNTMYGIGMGLINVATIIGALSVGFFAKKIQVSTLHYWLLIIAVLVLPTALSVTPIMLNLGYYPSFILFIISTVLIAMIMTIASIFVITKVQKKTPNENLGKVMAIITAASQCMAPIGQIIYGLAFESFSGYVYLPTLFVSIVMLGLTLLTYRMMRNEAIV